MKRTVWDNFIKARARYRRAVKKTERSLPGLRELQQKLVDSRPGPSYQIETPVVYNEALDDVAAGSEIKLILVADNPGRREQARENRRYLVGPSGKLAEKFFADHPALDIDFRKNVIILNKTPVHTPRTAGLAELCRLGGDTVKKAIDESEAAMVKLLWEFHECFAPIPVWITGYSEMKKGGVFETYTRLLKSLYAKREDRLGELFFFRHFSMNQFAADIRRQTAPGETESAALCRIGAAYRERILGTAAAGTRSL